MSLSIEVIGLDKLTEEVKQAGGSVKPLVRAALQNSSVKAQREIRQRAAHRTGALQRSVLNQVSYPSASVEVQEKYGQYVEYGTEPHDITPKNKQALFWKGALNPYKRVRHPGTKAKPFFAPGVEASLDYIKAQFIGVVEKISKELAGR